MSTRIAVMAKAPIAGQAKSRLAPALGLAGAAALAERLLHHAVGQAVAAALGPVTLWAAPDSTHRAFQCLRQTLGVALATQAGADLGERMAHAFRTAFADDPAPVLLMGTDAPALDAVMLRAAATALREHAVVFVPALDGGYALVGLLDAAPAVLAALFDGMPWSTPRVMAETRDRLAALGLRHAELPPVADIDEPADLVHLAHLQGAWPEALRAGGPEGP